MLKDLILRYDAWVKGGGTRASMAAPLSWEEEEQRERGYVPNWHSPYASIVLTEL